VVIAIIGILIALLLPAVQAAREASRRMKCANQEKQMALSWHLHHDIHLHFPTGGMGWGNVGDANLGYDGDTQVGGWIFNILDYMEQTNLRAMSKTRAGRTQMITTAVDFLYCPSRRVPVVLPTRYGHCNANYAPNVARSCYAANCGDQTQNEINGGCGGGSTPTGFSGVCYRKSLINFGQITGGTSHVIMLGEKYINPDRYYTGSDAADNEHPYTGFNNDIFRVTNQKPQQDRKGYGNTKIFGGPHPGGVVMAFCDASVHVITYDISTNVWRDMGNRNKGGHLE